MDIISLIEKTYKRLLISYRRKRKSNSTFFKSSTTKRVMNSCCSLSISAETENKRKEIHEKLKVLVKQYINAPEKLIQYLKLEGVRIYRFNNADKILDSLGEEEGFLIPLKGQKALILNLLIGIFCQGRLNISTRTNAMMIFNKKKVEIYTIARALYKYYGYKKEMPGYDYNSQTVFKRIYNNRNNRSPFATCTIQDMYACKEAIARDIESINFTIELSDEYEQAKKALKEMKEKTFVDY